MYGGTANRDGWGYPLPDPKYAFPDFWSMMEKSELVRESYDQGIARIARQLVKDIRYEFKPIQQAARLDDATRMSAGAADSTTRSAPARKSKARKSADVKKK